MDKIFCFGDSLTEGKPGISYIKFFKSPKAYKNYGLSGDTITHMVERLKKKINDTDYFIIGIGSNDILLPFFEDYSLSWNIAIKVQEKRNIKATEKLEDFIVNYENMLKLLIGKKVIIFSIPYFESSLDVLNEQALIYNKEIEKLCQKYKAPYVDIRSEQIKLGPNPTHKIPENWFVVPYDVILTRKEQNINKLSKERGLKLTVDGIHFNLKSASLLAKLIEEKIKSSF